MAFGNILDIPYNFICEHLTGWTVLIFIFIIIYFVALRKYYTKREQFYIDMTNESTKENSTDTNNLINTEENLVENYNKTEGEFIRPTPRNYKSKHPNEDDNNDEHNNDEHNDNNNSEHNNKTQNYEKPNKNKSSKSYQNTVKLRGTRVFEGFQTEPNTQETVSNGLMDNPTLIATTLFDNLQLTPSQKQSVKLKYNDVISTYITKLTRLVKLSKQNESLNVKKQYDIIIGEGIDTIINYLNNVIKTRNILTRTSIRADVVFTLQTTLEFLINKNNRELQTQITKIATMDSTTVNYNTMLKEINDIRAKLEEYADIDDILVKYGSSQNSTTREINKTLDKSFILPIYEKNIDRLNQLIKSDFNNDENNLAKKYSSAYNDFLQQQKKSELEINPLRLASQIESGVIGMLSSAYGSSNKPSDYEDDNTILEQYTAEYGYTGEKTRGVQSNPIPRSESGLLGGVSLNSSNIFSDPGNLGSYLIDKNTRKDILEGFATDSKRDEKKTNESTNIIDNLLSGDFINYILEQANDKLGMFFGFYNKNIDGKTGGIGGGVNGIGEKVKLEENMIPAGFLLFVLSMLIYFIDITSSS